MLGGALEVDEVALVVEVVLVGGVETEAFVVELVVGKGVAGLVESEEVAVGEDTQAVCFDFFAGTADEGSSSRTEGTAWGREEIG